MYYLMLLQDLRWLLVQEMYCFGQFRLPLQKYHKLVDLNHRNYYFPGFWILDPHAGIWPVHVVETAFGLVWGLLPSVWGTSSSLCLQVDGGRKCGDRFSSVFPTEQQPYWMIITLSWSQISPLRSLPPRMITSNVVVQSELQRNGNYKCRGSSFKYWGSLAFPTCESEQVTFF